MTVSQHMTRGESSRCVIISVHRMRSVTNLQKATLFTCIAGHIHLLCYRSLSDRNELLSYAVLIVCNIKELSKTLD